MKHDEVNYSKFSPNYILNDTDQATILEKYSKPNIIAAKPSALAQHEGNQNSATNCCKGAELPVTCSKGGKFKQKRTFGLFVVDVKVQDLKSILTTQRDQVPLIYCPMKLL